MKGVIKLKKEPHITWLVCGFPEIVDSYQQIRQFWRQKSVSRRGLVSLMKCSVECALGVWRRWPVVTGNLISLILEPDLGSYYWQ